MNCTRRHLSSTSIKRLICFPGQGSQYPGMCQDWIADPKFGSVARDFLNVRARNALGDQITEQLQKLMQSDGAEAQSLNSTEFAQPAIFMHSAIALNCYFSSIGEESVQNSVLVGHSVGEFAALYAAGSLEFESALHLVRKRGEIMKNRCEEGAMCALFPIKSVDLALEIAEKANCEIACYNSPTQVVLGGTVVQISKVMELARSAKIRRVIPLKVSTAFHTRLMLPALEEFTKILESTPMESLSPTSPEIISTITGNSLNHSTPSQIRSLLASQLCSPVLFSQAISRAISAFQLSEIIHIGPGTSLTGSISEHLKLSQSSPTYKTIDTPTQIH